MQQKRILLFTVLMVVLFGGWYLLGRWLFPEKPAKPAEPTAREALALALGLHPSTGTWDAGIGQAPPKARESMAVALGLHPSTGSWDAGIGKAPPKPTKPVETQPELKPGTRITLGSKERDSNYHLGVVLDTRGAAVRSVVLNKFKATDEKTGKPTDQVLELVPDPDNIDPEIPNKPPHSLSTNNVLYHFSGKDASQDNPKARPLATLGQINWKVSASEPETVTIDGHPAERISFTAEVDGVEITKTFTLAEGEYHLRLEVQLRRLGKDAIPFRYQLTGAHGLPIEGRWYTKIFRNALIAVVDGNGSVYNRDLQTSAQIGVYEGGSEIVRDPEHFIRYAGVANQYFASVIVVDKDQQDQRFLTRARPTLETALVIGKIEAIHADRLEFTPRKSTVKETFYFSDRLHPTKDWEGKEVALWHYTDPQYILDSDPDPQKRAPREIVYEVKMDPDQYPPVWVDDINVRVATKVFTLDSDEPEVQKYLLYNGPVKPRLLGYIKQDEGGVSPELVNFYEEHALNTMTDYHDPGMMGRFASAIYWTWLLVHSTNLMHWVLSKILWVIPSYGLAIMCLTVMVRGLMFPVSRKGALTSIRMQQLGPEIKKLQEKFKDDKQALQLATMELYRKHGVNPFGTCWFMFLQMPIFMGLYYALQESITFRLASFQPLHFLGLEWISNLAAPDMLWEWGEKIPYLTTPQSYGGFLYLGPYLNLLPIIAVTLMIMQQKLMTPPPTDEQQEMQQKMMKYMMVFMGLMFYKVAAGLCIYFIASSLWGFAERKLLPKKKPTPTDGASVPATSANLLSRVIGGSAASSGSTAVTAEVPGKGKGRRRGKDRGPVQVELPEVGGTALQRVRRWFRRKRDGLSDWWAEVLKQAAKKER